MFSTKTWHHEQKSWPHALPCINIFIRWTTILTIRGRWIEKWLPVEYCISMMMSWHGKTLGIQGKSTGEHIVPQDPLNKKPALEQIMGWCRTGDKPLPEPTRTTRIPAFWGYPTAPWLPILLYHIGSQVKTRQSQSYKFKEFAKTSIFLILKKCFWKIQSGHDSVHRWTDGPMDGRTVGRTDGQGETSLPHFNFVERRA